MTDITGRDHLIMCKALAYAAVTIERLPAMWRENNDCDDMKELLLALTGDARRYDYYMNGCAQPYRASRYEGGGQSARACRSRHQQQRRGIEMTGARAVIAMLSELAPECIMPACPKPLKVGIEKDLVHLARQGGVEPHELTAALNRYTSTDAYLMALRAGAVRVGADGQPAGIVSAGAARSAQEQLADRIIAQGGRNRRRRRIAAATPAGRTDVIRSFQELGRAFGRGGRR